MFDEYGDQDAMDCADGDYNTWEENQVFLDREGDEGLDEIPEIDCDNGEHDYEYNVSCGAHICWSCDDHKGLARCYCGWAADGGDGRQELVDMGENIEEDL